jgi:hypothetical protein
MLPIYLALKYLFNGVCTLISKCYMIGFYMYQTRYIKVLMYIGA